jgi:hypothetical protein
MLMPPRSFFELYPGADEEDAAWNSLATNVPNSLNPEYVMMSGRIYKRPEFVANEQMSAHDKAIYQQKQDAIDKFSREDNSTTPINYDQLVNLQQQSAVKNFIDGRNAAEKVTPKDREAKVLLLQQLGAITAIAQDMYKNGNNLVDSSLSDMTKEFYRTLYQLQAPNTANSSLLPMAAERNYTNSRIAVVLDQLLKDSSGIVSSDELYQYLRDNPDLVKIIRNAGVRPVAPAIPVTSPADPAAPVDPAATVDPADPAATPATPVLPEEEDPAAAKPEDEEPEIDNSAKEIADTKFFTDNNLKISTNHKAINFLKNSYLVKSDTPQVGDLVEWQDPKSGQVSYGILSRKSTTLEWQAGFRTRENQSFAYKPIGNIDNKNVFHLVNPGKAQPVKGATPFMEVLSNDNLYTLKSSRNYMPLENRVDLVRKDLENLYNFHRDARV